MFLPLFIFSAGANLLSTKYVISKVVPDQIPSSGHINVELTIDPPYTGECFCKFDTTIVKGFGEKDGTVICQAPRHIGGDIYVYFSPDGENWSTGLLATYTVNVKTMWIIVAIIAGTCLASFGLFWWQMRQCKNSSRKNRANAQVVRDGNFGFDDDEGFQPLRRNSPHLL
ncbi:hypothetical protein TRFO_26611 [Tritrichomonas foetus]|uniref:IPT/TIG domain-containing protein n=1 Tax=Tritrichomonas foetus TaxID=1144522 RepID=A0A1J4K3Q6_9EUKA|nr:hypothetical protein TRFO_26611 [Tritrichomonas foetus]|eukprot:OHT05602.1 hypothetical protein TRFO_26611 [Tritrichomonas foetus]